jgi:outer membrane protein TolC
VDAALAAALEAHPALAAEGASVEAAEQRRALAYRNRYPDLTLGLAPIQVGTRLEAWELMFEIEIPLHQATRRHQEHEATLMRDAAAARRDATSIELRGRSGEIRSMWEGAREQRALVEHTLLPQADANFASALASYQVGAVDFTTLLDALRQRRAADLTRLDAMRDALLSAAALRSLIGATP